MRSSEFQYAEVYPCFVLHSVVVSIAVPTRTDWIGKKSARQRNRCPPITHAILSFFGFEVL